MVRREHKPHEGLQAIVIDEKINIIYEGGNNGGDSFSSSLLLEKIKKYRFVAYPGPEVVGEGRCEHLPYHFHIVPCKNGLCTFEEYRILLSNFKEYKGKRIPKFLTNLFKDEEFRKRISLMTINVFHKGNV